MAGFVFRLQNVLDYRTSLADRAKQELSALQARLQEAESALAVLKRAERQTLRGIEAAHATATLDLAEITTLLEYSQVLAERIVQQRGVIAARRQEVDAQQRVTIALAKDAKALEKLREHQIEEVRQEDNRREQAETSEIASIRHQRQQVS